MKSHQYNSFQSAIDDLSSKGKLTYQGRIGMNAEICLYLYKVGIREYRLYIYLDGRVEWRN